MMKTAKPKTRSEIDSKVDMEGFGPLLEQKEEQPWVT